MKNKQLLIALSFAVLTGISYQACGMEEEPANTKKENTSLYIKAPIEPIHEVMKTFNSSQTGIPTSEIETKKLSPATLVTAYIPTDTETILRERVTVLEKQIAINTNRITTENEKLAQGFGELSTKLNELTKKFNKNELAIKALGLKEMAKSSYLSRASNLLQGFGYSFLTGFGLYTGYQLIKQKTGLLESYKGWATALGATFIGLRYACIKFRKVFIPSTTLNNYEILLEKAESKKTVSEENK